MIVAICLSHAGTTSYSSDSPSDKLLIGSGNGVYTIKREGAKAWQVAENSLEGSHVSTLLAEPASGLIFAGVYKGGVFASVDSGRSWERRDQGLSEKDVHCINAVGAASRVKLYAGTEPAHLFESDDLGETWRELTVLRTVPSVSEWTFPAPPHHAHVKNIAIDPHEARIIYVGVEVGGLFKSEDSGQSWKELRGFYADVHRIVIRPSEPKWLYLCTGDGLYHSRDGGESWEHLTTNAMRIAYPDPLLIHAKKENLIFMAGAISTPGTWRKTHTADSRIAHSRNGGKTWEVLHHGLPEHLRANVEALAMEVWNGSGALFAGTTDGDVFYSEDEGERWSRIVNGLPPICKWGHSRNLR
jgi:photosystem II stability/assembly factor-like uncharacterized protein